MVEMPRAEGLDRLRDEVAMLLQHVGGDDEFLGIVGDGVERHAEAKVVLAEIFAREHRRILQRLIADGLVGDASWPLAGAPRRGAARSPPASRRDRSRVADTGMRRVK